MGIIHNLSREIIKRDNAYHVALIIIFKIEIETKSLSSNSKFNGIFFGFGSQNPKC